MRYAIYFTPPAHHPLTLAASQWLGRSAFSGEAVEPPPIRGIGLHDIAFHTALPRRFGFHATLKSPFRLADGFSEVMLLRHLMRFAGMQPRFELPPLEVVRFSGCIALAPVVQSETMRFLAASVVQEFDGFRDAPSEDDIERLDTGELSAAQFSNLHRWGDPHAMDEFRFHMTLTGPLSPLDMPRFEPALRDYFAPYLDTVLEVANLALFVEEEPGAPFLVHSLHPMGEVSSRRIA